MTTFANEPSVNDLYAIKLTSIDGNKIDLKTFKGKYILFVNTASECGYTPQYKKLEELHQKYKSNLVIIGMPCNDFGGQEPGKAQEIKSFCEKNYGVTFLMTEKVNVKSEPISPIYKWLTQKSENGTHDIKVKWNFHKILVDPMGHIIDDFSSSVSPLDDKIVDKLK